MKTLVLASLLKPEDLGDFAFALSILIIAETLTQTGLFEALVSRAEVSEDFLHAAWTAQLLRCLLLGIGLAIISPWICHLYNRSHLVPILDVLALQGALIGFENVGLVYLQRELNFRRVTIGNGVVAAISLVTTVVFAVILRSVWALVLSSLITAVARVFISYVLHDFRPKFCLSAESVKRLFLYGRWISASNILGVATRRADTLILSAFVGGHDLGIFQLAMTVAFVLPSEAAAALLTSSLALFSKLSRDTVRTRDVLYVVLAILSLVFIPIAALITIFGPRLIPLFSSGAWTETVPLLGKLSLACVIFVIDSIWTSPLLARGLAKLEFQRALVRALFIIGCMIPLAGAFGIAGAATALLMGHLSAIPFWLKNANTFGLSATRIATIISPGCAICLSTALIYSVFAHSRYDGYAVLVALPVATVIGLGIAALAIRSSVLAEEWQILKNAVSPL